jgi:hypothetical protein
MRKCESSCLINSTTGFLRNARAAAAANEEADAPILRVTSMVRREIRFESPPHLSSLSHRVLARIILIINKDIL